MQSQSGAASLGELGAVHFVGIGGAGMSGIARIMLARGVPVSGSDAKHSTSVAALQVLGARVAIGHDAANLRGVDTVVVSTAISETNPELAGARERGLRVLRRAEALAQVMAGSRGVAVAGTHGKTSTTSMLTVALQHCGVDPSFAVGGDLNEAGSNAHSGAGELFVAEADESDGSFLSLTPFAGVVTNVEADHLDHYGGLAEIEQAFRDFSARIAPDGFLVACADDPGSAALAEHARSQGVRVLTYGTDGQADLTLTDLEPSGSGMTYVPSLVGRRLPRVTLGVPGRHMALNSAAALLVGAALGLPEPSLVEGLGLYAGVRRRMEHKGVAGGIAVYDDYAHHPTEIAAQLLAARQVAEGRVVVAFQPHRFSRTQAFAAELGQALGLADEVVVMSVYPAGEAPLPGVDGALVASLVPATTPARYEPSFSAVPSVLAGLARGGDLVLTMGAGDVTMIGPELLDELRKQG